MRKVSRRNFLKATGAAAAVSALAGLFTGCGSTSSGEKATADNTVNIGATGSLGTLNPLMVDATWINMYAATLQFCPLTAMDASGAFVGMLADKVETTDKLAYTIHIADDAKWSDGEDITSADLKFTMKCLTSAKLGNATMLLSQLVGTNDETGYRDDGVDDIEGVEIVDDKTCVFHLKSEMGPNVFQSGYAQYIYTVPEHILKDVAEDQLASYDWFNTPTVVSGPYAVVASDANHYISYRYNEKYWKGTPAIHFLNIKIVEAAQLLTGLQSGEIDVVPPLLGSISQDDYSAVQALPNITAAFGERYAAEALYINCNSIPEKEIRQAMLYALDRQKIIDNLLDGEADLADGFAVPAGPYWRDVTATPCDVAKAQSLVQQAASAGWDSTRRYGLYVNSGDQTLINAVTMAVNYWEAVGVHVDLNTVDLSTLMTMCGEGSGDIYGVQYTYAVGDPSWDINYVLPYWCFYQSDAEAAAAASLQGAADDTAYADALAEVDRDVQANVPIITMYVTGPLGAVAKRVSGAAASMYGCLNNVQEWTISAQ